VVSAYGSGVEWVRYGSQPVAGYSVIRDYVRGQSRKGRLRFTASALRREHNRSAGQANGLGD